MHSTTLITAIFSLATFISAAPTTSSSFKAPAPFAVIDETSQLSKRNIGGVRLSDGANFTGHVWYGIYPLNDCIGLNDYAGNLQSFRPDEGTECMIFQGQCNASDDYASLSHDSEMVGDLSVFSDWIGNVNSYMCFTEIDLSEARTAGRVKELIAVNIH
ncbi:hypothetical protein LTR37_013541 [Vermiconidia calcicola]|uniref:Uncharacterized protein n=1 Tax=Vermiconidia calcicola TaxID=1690605 RepID=A0ACC3MXG4_9PEZI|nr:hypothetical protein LTR37_013541 [Vermiconidia calcicola]